MGDGTRHLCYNSVMKFLLLAFSIILAGLFGLASLGFAQTPIYTNCTPTTPNYYVGCQTLTPTTTKTTIPLATTTLTPIPIPYITQVDPRATQYTLTPQYNDVWATPTQETWESNIKPPVYRVNVNGLNVRSSDTVNSSIVMVLPVGSLFETRLVITYKGGYAWVQVLAYTTGATIKGVTQWVDIPQPAFVALGQASNNRITNPFAILQN